MNALPCISKFNVEAFGRLILAKLEFRLLQTSIPVRTKRFVLVRAAEFLANHFANKLRFLTFEVSLFHLFEFKAHVLVHFFQLFERHVFDRVKLAWLVTQQLKPPFFAKNHVSILLFNLPPQVFVAHLLAILFRFGPEIDASLRHVLLVSVVLIVLAQLL